MIQFFIVVGSRGHESYLGTLSHDTSDRLYFVPKAQAKAFSNMADLKKALEAHVRQRLDAGVFLNDGAISYRVETVLEDLPLGEASTPAISEAQAQGLLDILTRFYRQPVMPIRRYCDALETWASKVIELNADGGGEGRHGNGYARQLPEILMDIRKSNLLARLLYAGEKVRTQKCPDHKGSWVGQGDCHYGCDLTGWLPEKPEVRQRKPVDTVY